MDNILYYCWTNLLILLACFTKSTISIKVSACHGTDEVCDFFELICGKSEKIQLLDQVYGYKGYECNHKKKRERCFTSGTGCCTYDTRDCLGPYTTDHVYKLYTQCSGWNDCGPYQVPNALLSTCDSNVSTYAIIDYQCVPDSTVIGFCENSNIQGSSINIMFEKSIRNNIENHTGCSCLLNAVDDAAMTVNITAVDIRLLRSDAGSRCSSSTIKVRPFSNDPYTVSCDSTDGETGSFVHQYSYDIPLDGTGQFYIDLDDLYKEGPDDAPVMAWIALEADTGSMSVTCFESVPIPSPTTPATTSTTPATTSTVAATTDDGGGPHNTTAAGAASDAGGSTGVVIGVLVAIILLIAVGVVVGIILWRRKHRPTKRKKTSGSHDYHENGPGNSMANDVYDEIGFVPGRNVEATPSQSTAAGQPTDYRTNTLTRDQSCSQNGKVYENTKEAGISDVESQHKTNKHRFKMPYMDIKAARMRLLSYFHKQNDQNQPPVAPQNVRADRGSYDHINSVEPVKTKISPPTGDTEHTYSHTADTRDMSNLSATHANNNEQTPEPAKRRDIQNADNIHAVQLTDSYIEFQFGNGNEVNKPCTKNRIATQDKPGNIPKPVKPNRPPPKPGKHPNTSTNITELKSAISPQTSSECANEPSYDYAETESLTHNRQSSSSDVSQHSYTILETEPIAEATYDYAEDDGNNLETAPPIPDNIYEEVNDNKKARSKKYKSAGDLPQDIVGYLEPSVGNNRPRSIPTISTDATDQTSVDSNSKRKQEAEHTYVNRVQDNGNLVTPPLQSQSKSPMLPRRDLPTAGNKKAITNIGKRDEEQKPKKLQDSTSDVNEKSSVLKMAKLFDQVPEGSVAKKDALQTDASTPGYMNTPPRVRGMEGLSHDALTDMAAHTAVGRMSSDA